MASRREELEIRVKASDNASKTVDAVADKLEALQSAQANVDVTATDEASEVIDNVTENVDDLDQAEAEPTLSAEDDATEVVEDVTTAVEDLDEATAEPAIDADDAASDVIAGVSDDLFALDGEVVSSTIEADDQVSGAAAEAVEALEEVEDTFTATIAVEGAEDAETDAGGLTTELGKGAAAAAGIVTGLLAVGTSASDQILEVAALAEAIGAPLDEASRLKEVWDLAGGSIDTLERNVIRANDRLRESPELANRLGIEINENTSPMEAFIAAVKALNSGQLTTNERLAIAMDLFGSRGILMLDDLQTRVGDIDEAMAGVGENELITQEQVDQAIEFQAQWDAVGDKIAEIGREALPAVNLALEGLVGLMDGRLLTAVENLADRLTPDWLFGDGNALDELMGEDGALFETQTPTPEQIDLVNEYLATHDELGNVIDAEGDATGELAGKNTELEIATTDANAAFDDQAEALETLAEQLEENIEALTDYIDAQRSSYDANVRHREATEDAADAIANYAEVSADAEASDEDRRDAGQAVVSTILAEADAYVAMTQEAAAARGETLSNQRAVENWNSSLAASAATIDEELIPQVVDMAMEINDIPESRRTEVEAAIATGDPEIIETTLNNLSRTRKAAIQADVDTASKNNVETALNNLARDRYAKVITSVAKRGSFAQGTQHSPAGSFLVGEQGAELVSLPTGASVTNAGQTAEMLRNGAGAGTTVNNYVTNNWPRGMPSRDVAAALRRQQRVQGRAY